MPQSLARICLHTIFSTKDRRRVFRTDEMRNNTQAYITGILKNLDCPIMRIKLAVDHLHILHLHSRKHTVADVIAAVKRESNAWIKTQPWARGNSDFAQFHWQKGYGVFSVSESKVPVVVKYIEGQQEHHKRVTFQDEYREFMKRHGIAIDERYVWD